MSDKTAPHPLLVDGSRAGTPLSVNEFVSSRQPGEESVCVFCGSSEGNNPIYGEAADGMVFKRGSFFNLFIYLFIYIQLVLFLKF